MPTLERKKQLNTDLWIILIISMLNLGIFMIFNNNINKIAYNPEINIILRVLFIGVLFQFGLAGLGITIVSILRKESFLSYGLCKEKLLPTIALSALGCFP